MIESPDRTVDLTHLLVRVRRRWRTVLAVTGIVTAGALASGLTAPVSYTATASVAVAPIRFSTSAGTWYTQDVNITTEQAVLGSRQVADLASAALHRTVDATTLVRAATVTAPQGSAVLQLTVATNDARNAATWANALTQAYLAFRAQSAQQAAQSSLAAIDVQIRATQPSFAKTLTALQAQKTALQHVGDGTARIIGTAVTPSAPSSQGIVPVLVGGVVGGLLLGAVLALLRDALDPRARFGRRFGEVLGAETVELREDDDEAVRAVLRAARGAADPAGPVVVTVATTTAGVADALLRSVAGYAARTGQRIRIVAADRLPAEQLDGRWSFTPEAGDEIVLLDAQQVASPTRLAVLGDVSDASVVVGDSASRVRDLRALATALRSGRALLVPVYLATPAGRSAAKARRVRKAVAVTPSA